MTMNPSTAPRSQDRGLPPIDFKPAGHDLVSRFDPARLATFPRTRACYDELLAEAQRPTLRRQLGNVAHALLHLHGSGTRDFRPSVVGAVTQRCGGPGAKTLSNATSGRYRRLIDTFEKETGAGAATTKPKQTDGIYDEIIRALPNLHHRAAVLSLVQSRKSDELQIRLLKQQVGGATLPLTAPLLGGYDAPATVVAPGSQAWDRGQAAGAEGDDVRRAVLRKVFSDAGLRRRELAIIDGELLMKKINHRILNRSELTAILELLGVDADDGGRAP